MSYRVMQKFWLDLDKPQEEEINQMIDQFKRKREFSRIIRDGIRLIGSLGQGNLAVLLALFPWVEEAFYERFTERQNTLNSSLQQQLERLERLLIEQGNTPVASVLQSVNTSSGGIKKLDVPPVAPPVFDDDDDDITLVVRKAKDDGSSARNFLDSVFALQRSVSP